MKYGDLKTSKDRLGGRSAKAQALSLKISSKPVRKLSKEHHAYKKSIKDYMEDKRNDF